MLAELIDKALDWTVIPGYSRIGYSVRRRFWDRRDAERPMSGWTVLVTGAGSGIGKSAAEAFAHAGAEVHMLVRNRERGERAREEVARRSGSERIELELCDVSDLASVREFSARFASANPELHVLVNNAGAMPVERTHTEEGFELTFATNVLGPFLLTDLLLPALRRGAPSRIVNVSSGGMYTAKLDVDDLQLEHRDYDPPAFYAHSKRCEVILTGLWAERLRGSGVGAHSMHPGWAATPGVATSLPRFNSLMGPLLRDADQGADTIVWLATAPEAARAPGAFWHDRRPRPVHRVPWTRESETDRRRLWDECARLAGLDSAGAPATTSAATGATGATRASG